MDGWGHLRNMDSKAGGGEERGELLPSRRTARREPHHQSVVGQEKKHFGLITILNDSKGMRSSLKIRQLGNRRLLKPQSGEDFHLRSLCRGHVLILAVEPLPSLRTKVFN